ncbi:hypothetical protein [Saccharibacillus kuerlensis]|uniref:Uncharacterized protein n=1 Tax=Saccharibacillus kuerlensis TaxID=459527 RepID=A0ABQ2L7P2_9BACL|nr:hypothetical protein [Saccharibacillus kuerlensis]GGO04918.1 hypothetical protein GCM10010969_30690 [Saccharibacillus kuerlensis]
MFEWSDLISLIVSAFVILPVVVFLRESGYLLGSMVFGVRNPRITLGSGPRLFKLGLFDVRRYYHLYSWFSYDDLKYKSRFAYVCLYAGPILINLMLAFTINTLLANGTIQWQQTFWDRLVFYSFYYALFDIVPMRMTNGKPNNGLIIYEMLRYGRRIDYNHEPFLASTTETEKHYLEEMEAYAENEERDPILKRKKQRRIKRAETMKRIGIPGHRAVAMRRTSSKAKQDSVEMGPPPSQAKPQEPDAMGPTSLQPKQQNSEEE